jgi:hypothetical protein
LARKMCDDTMQRLRLQVHRRSAPEE